MDYRNATTHTSSTAASMAKLEAKFNPFWWQAEDKDQRTKAFIDVARALETNSQDLHQANLRHARIYENVELDTLTPGDYAASVVKQALAGRGVVRFNVVAMAIDTLAAKIAKNKPRPMFLTSGGSWDQQIKARRLNKFGQGLFYETRVHEHAKEIFNDACIFGTGVMHVFKGDDGRLEVERVMVDELYVDDADAHYGKPRSIFRRKMVHREVLCSMFPESTDAIYASDPPNQEHSSDLRDSQTPMVEVWEGWHLGTEPSNKKNTGGKHVIAIDGHELFCEDWKMDQFPFVAFRFKKRTVGFWGKGVAETLTGIQIELNRLVNSISEQLRRKGRGRIFVQKGSSLNPAHLTNQIADIINYVGSPPIVDNQNAVAPEEFMQIDRLYQRALQEVGVSELSASAKKPSGLDAAVALREYSDIESERFSLVHQAWEQFFLDFMALALGLIRNQTGSKGYNVRLPSKRLIVQVDWKDIDLDEDSYIMQMFPVSSLPNTPAARYQKVKEMMSDGFIDKAVAQRLLEFPDIEAETNLGNAAIDDVDETISAILDAATPELLPLEPYQNHQLLAQRALAAYLFARHNGCDEERLDLMRHLIDMTTAEIEKATAPPPSPGAPGEVPPPAGAGTLGPGGPPMMPMGMPGMSGASLGNLNVNVAPPAIPPVAPPVVA